MWKLLVFLKEYKSVLFKNHMPANFIKVTIDFFREITHILSQKFAKLKLLLLFYQNIENIYISESMHSQMYNILSINQNSSQISTARNFYIKCIDIFTSISITKPQIYNETYQINTNIFQQDRSKLWKTCIKSLKSTKIRKKNSETLYSSGSNLKRSHIKRASRF